MTDIEDIRTALAAALDRGIDGFQVSPYMLANPSPPAIHVYPTQVDYDLTMHRGYDTIELVVQALVGLTTDQGAQKKLDTLLAPAGAGSVKAAVESDKTLGGLVQNARVVQATGYRVYSFEHAATGALRGPVLGCDWTISVIA